MATNDTTPTDADDEPSDESSATDTDAPETITLEIEYEIEHELDEIHAPAWGAILAAAPSEKVARDTITRRITDRVEGAVDVDTIIYEQYQLVQRQRRQARQKLGEGHSVDEMLADVLDGED